jgi:hypothetical protein
MSSFFSDYCFHIGGKLILVVTAVMKNSMKAIRLLPLTDSHPHPHTPITDQVNNLLYPIRQALRVLILAGWLPAFAQTPTTSALTSGKISDATTGQGIPFASVAIKGKPIGTQADAEGHYQLRLHQPTDSLLVSALGYQTARVVATTSTVDVALTPAAAQLNEVTVRAGENPAFRILRAINSHRKQNDFTQLSGYEYEAYSQLAISINQLSDRFRQRKPVRAILRALEQKQGNRTATVLPVFLSETVSRLYARRHPRHTKEQVLKTNISSVGITDDSFMAMFTGAGFNTLNFYQNQVSLFRKEFISPLAEGGRSAYTYFLADTTQVGQHTCYGIDFDPRNERDLVFRGRMWIDTLSYALVRMEAHVGAAANLNFINQIDIDQTYEIASDSAHTWMPETTHLRVQVGEVVKNTFGAVVDYSTSVRQVLVGQPKPVDFFTVEVALNDDRSQASPEYWQAQREQSLSSQEQTRALLDTVRSLPIVKTYTKGVQFVLNGGYLPLMRGVDAGSLFSLWAYNPVEGHRLRMGLQTNNAFSRTWQLSAYGAYGTRDRVWKTGWEVNFIPTRSPLTLVSVKHSYDLEQLGFRMEDLADNAFLRATSRFGPYPRSYYQRETALTAQRDLGPDFTQTVGIRNRSMHLLFPFALNQGNEAQQLIAPTSDLQSTEYYLETRYAPGRLPARRIPSRRIRRRPTETAPIVSLRFTLGSSTANGRSSSYHKVQLQWDHALRWGLWGRTNYTVRAGYTSSTLPYPLLDVHVGNQTPFYNRNAFNLMNYAEFVSDRYVSVGAEHKFDGLLTNRLPLIRRWGWRTFMTGKVLWGHLSSENRSLIATRDATGQRLPPVYSLHQKPYAEVGYGVENVLKCLRIEALHRLTYRQHPTVSRYAVKASFQLSL